jgi:nucleotide-binding universal stress UspA family protein
MMRAKRSSAEPLVQSKPEQMTSFATMMVYVDGERHSEQRIELALALAERFGATLIGIAGLTQRPAFIAGNVVVYTEPRRNDFAKATARFEEMGKRFAARCQSLKQFEWRSAPEFPSELVVRNARAADLIIVGPRRAGARPHDVLDPGAILLRAGRPVLIVPDKVAALPCAAW